ncbi:MAG: 4Fe-4S binding protein [Cyclobacteriaceae bacterium]
MKQIHITGLILFFIGFGLWLGSFFLSSYTVTQSVLEATYQKEGNTDLEKINIFKANADDLMDQSYDSNFKLINDLKKAIKSSNEAIKDQFILSSEEINQIAASLNYPATFKLEEVKDIISSEDKFSNLEEYGNWLDGRKYEKIEDLKDNLNLVADNVEKYGLSESGFSESKEQLFALVKASEKGPIQNNASLWLLLTYGLTIIGALMYLIPKLRLDGPAGIKNNGIFFNALKSRGWIGILLGSFLIVFYIMLYFFPQYMTSWVSMVDPISQFLKGNEANQFFLYGFIYTLCILVMGGRMIIKYRHSKYQILRTISVMFFQTAFAFIIPEIMLRLNQPYFDFKNIWPLNYSFFFDSNLHQLISEGTLGIFMLVWGIALIVIAVPFITYFFGKRWYCSWVCGCGGLAETLGDPYRQLSDKSLKAWKIERWMIHGVLVFAVVMTAGVLYTFFTESASLLGVNTYQVRSVYGAWIGAGFAGVVGTGFYPIMGNRVWCRFGCPLAAYLGIVQRFKSKFRITTNGGQCISCGNCSTYCEMGIDVRWYAQRGQNIVRSSCVGCGVCSSVCPRGVLNLENRDEDGRINQPVLIGNDSISIKS